MEEGRAKAIERMDAFLARWNQGKERKKTPILELEEPTIIVTDIEQQILNGWIDIKAKELELADNEMQNDELDSDNLETLESRKVVKDVNYIAHYQIHHTACLHNHCQEHER